MTSSESKGMHWVYYFGRFLARILLFTMSDWRVRGRQNITGRGPMVIVSNHLHVVDPPIIAVSLPLQNVLLAKEELFRHRWNRFWVKNFGSVPVRRSGSDRAAIRQAEYWLRRGKSLIMFPEGRRTATIAMQPALPGAALIASRLGVPILPVSITGTERLRERYWWLLRPRITVTIGQPIPPPSPNGKLSRPMLQQMTTLMMENIAGLLPPEYRGVYAGGENAGDRKSQ